MQKEIEATFENVDHEKLRRILIEQRAILKQPECMMRRTIFDYQDRRLDKQAAWIRVRQEATRNTMCYKQRQNETIQGMREIEFEISDYDSACDFLTAIGLITKAKQETKREIWELDDCEIMLDTWPWIPAFAEVEGVSEDAVKKVAAKLGFNWSAAIFDSSDAQYTKHFDVTRTEISSCSIDFGPIPDWLEQRRIQ